MSDRTCYVEGCERDKVARGYCRGHYSRWSKGQPLDGKPLRPLKKCSVDGCDRDHNKKSFCVLHFARWERYGDTDKRVYVSRTADRDARAVELLRQGTSYDMICEETGIPRTYLSTLAGKHGLLQRVKGRICSVDECDKPHSSKGYCSMHYTRVRETGTTDPRPTLGLDAAARYRRWCQNNPDLLRDSTRKWRANNPEKRRAHRKVEVALKFGRLRRRACNVCGDPKSHAHHDDYTKPLDVIWLCAFHHVERHRILKELGRDPHLTAGAA